MLEATENRQLQTFDQTYTRRQPTTSSKTKRG